MIQNGLEYSYITSGEAFVFLHINEHNLTTLYYHLAILSEDISADDFTSSHSRTAISQVASLCLLASRSEQRTQQWQKKVKKQLKRYQINWQSILDQIPASERKLAPVSAYKGRTGSVVSRYNIRLWHGKGNPRKPRDDDLTARGSLLGRSLQGTLTQPVARSFKTGISQVFHYTTLH